MKKGLIISCVILIALSAYGFIESSRLERTMKMGIGIGFLPFAMSLAIGGLSIALLVSILRGRAEIKSRTSRFFSRTGGPTPPERTSSSTISSAKRRALNSTTTSPSRAAARP